MQLITLTTDFGTRDHYVGAMKGVMLRIAPRATLVDITHEIPAHNVMHGAFVLRRTLDWFPPGTVHAVIVDPGVGSSRRIVAMSAVGQTIISPDNGLVSLVHRDFPVDAIHSVENPRYFPGPVSHTFHGRDIIAPVAAHVACGAAISELGPTMDRIVLLAFPKPEPICPAGLRGSVESVDRFGNLITNMAADDLAKMNCAAIDMEIVVGDKAVAHFGRTYTDVDSGAAIALIGSAGMLEIAINGGRACDTLWADVGTPVIVRPRETR